MSSGYKLQPNEREFVLPSLANGIELSCILTSAVTIEQIQESQDPYPLDKCLKLCGDPYPETKRAVIIMHGIGGHKNYNYHSKLARKLAHEQGITSIRFDFRNCGASTKTGALGRTLQDDVDDCHAVYQYLVNEGYSVDALIGHSRGVVDVFNWQLQNKDRFIPNIVACAGRFIGKGLPDSIRKSHPDFEQRGGHYIKGFQDGSFKEVWVPLKETQSLGALYMDGVKTITKYSDTILVYGIKEDIIPLQDSAHYANCLGDRNTLVLVPNATHSYYGTERVPESEWENSEIPINKKLGKADYNYQVADIVSNWLSPEQTRLRFFEKTKYIHEFLPRWKEVDGVSNFRDIGGWKTLSPNWSEGKHIKWGRIFRCASIDDLTLKGQEQIKELGITKVFDFRSSFEIEETHFELLNDVQFHSLASNKVTKDGSGFYRDMANSWKTYEKVYQYLIQNVLPLYKPIFEHLRDSEEPILYHCKAGKDRTGTLTAVILSLLRVPNEIIAREYELTYEGLKPDHEKLGQFIKPMLTKFGIPEQKGMDNLICSKYEVMLATLKYLESEYGSTDQYLKTMMGLSQEDLDTIRENLLF